MEMAPLLWYHSGRMQQIKITRCERLDTARQRVSHEEALGWAANPVAPQKIN
jgi:hypothetical protein